MIRILPFFLFLLLPLLLPAQRFFSSDEIKELKKSISQADTLQAKQQAEKITFAEQKKLRYLNVQLKSKLRFLQSGSGELEENMDLAQKDKSRIERELKILEREPKKNEEEIRNLKSRMEDVTEKLEVFSYQKKEHSELLAGIERVNKAYLEYFISQKSAAVQDQLALFAAEEELYRVREMIRQLGTYAGFHIGGEDYFTRICENADRLEANDVRKNTLTVYATWYIPHFEEPEKVDKLKAEFYLYKGKEIVIYENFTLRPVKELTRIPEAMHYMLSSFIDKGQIFYGDYSFWPNVIKERNLADGEYYYEILIEKELADFCTFRLQ